jgi:hypothetical protein
MTMPGITVTKYPTLAAWTHPAVHFDNVPMPKSMMVGALHQARKVVMGCRRWRRGSGARYASALARLLREDLDRFHGDGCHALPLH